MTTPIPPHIVEEVARAIFNRPGSSNVPWAYAEHNAREAYRGVATAAIEAYERAKGE